MKIVKRTQDFLVLGILVLSSVGCYAGTEASLSGGVKISTDGMAPSAVSTEQISEALRSPDEDVSETLLGTLVIKHFGDSRNSPGKIYLNGDLIYTARQQEALPHLRGAPFRLYSVSFQTNGKKQPDFRITRMVIRETSWTCQYIVLDFTGPKVWISERFPKDAFQKGQCVDMTWVRWERQAAYFYFGADEQDWEKGVYRGWVEGYNPKLKAVFGPVDAPPPPKGASLVPKRKPH